MKIYDVCVVFFTQIIIIKNYLCPIVFKKLWHKWHIFAQTVDYQQDNPCQYIISNLRLKYCKTIDSHGLNTCAIFVILNFGTNGTFWHTFYMY